MSSRLFARRLLNVIDRRDGVHREPTSTALAEAIARLLARSNGVEALAAAIDAASEGPDEVAQSMDSIRVAVTGLGWLGEGVPSLEQGLLDAIAEASEEILITSFSVTSGATTVFDALVAALQRGVRTSVAINRFDQQEAAARTALTRLQSIFPHSFLLHDFVHRNELESLHAKLLVVDRRLAIVGSANLSFLGMISNHELGVIVRGPTAAAVAECIDKLLRAPEIRKVPHRGAKPPSDS